VLPQETSFSFNYHCIVDCVKFVWNCVLLQFNAKKRLVYGGIVFIWIFGAVQEIISSNLTSDIISGTCIPLAAKNSYVVSWVILIIAFLLPLTAMLFCYTRIVYRLRRKVMLTLRELLKILLPTRK